MKKNLEKGMLKKMHNLDKKSLLKSLFIVAIFATMLFGLSGCASSKKVAPPTTTTPEMPEYKTNSVTINDTAGDGKKGIDLTRGKIKISKAGKITVNWYAKRAGGLNQQSQYKIFVQPKKGKKFTIFVDKLQKNGNVIYYFAKGNSQKRTYISGHYNSNETSVDFNISQLPELKEKVTISFEATLLGSKSDATASKKITLVKVK